MLTVGNIAYDPTLESSISVADADAYHAARGNAEWAGLDLVVKEQLLRKATDYIIATYGNVWSATVKLMTVAPLLLAQATAELALAAKSGPLIPIGTRGKKRVKIGPLEVEYDDASTVKNLFVFASRKLAPLLEQRAGGMVKLHRC